jgi:hypothetical protein
VPGTCSIPPIAGALPIGILGTDGPGIAAPTPRDEFCVAGIRGTRDRGECKNSKFSFKDDGLVGQKTHFEQVTALDEVLLVQMAGKAERFRLPVDAKTLDSALGGQERQ